jgi:ATP-binding cassette subfamily F protein 3
MRAFEPVLAMKAELHDLEERLGDASVSEAEHDALLSRYSELQDRFRAADGYSLDLKVATVLRGLGFSQEDFERPTETFSGGWQMRIALAKLLLGRPTLLLLDEPTNHLDLEARNWLEEYLAQYPHSVILVSHDRFFLDAVVTRITEIGLRALTDYPGNYTEYLKDRDERLERLREAKRRQDEEVARVKAFIDRFRYQATKASQVQSRVKMLEKVVPIEIPPERKRVHFTFPPCAKSGRSVIELSRASKRYGEKVVFASVDLLIERGDRLALVGPNGAGKSTLMRLLSGVEPPDTGSRTEGHQVVTQYFAQDEAARLDPTLTVYETLETGSPANLVPAIRNILGGFLFSGDDVYKKAGVLSGGERTRLAVARMLLRASNTLLLDEPTNHLDLDSKDVLLEALEDFGGTLIFVSHDRYFVDRLATKIVEVGGGGILVYPGTYEEFRWSKQSRGSQPKPQISRPSPEARSPRPQAKSPKPQAPSPKPNAPGPRHPREAHAEKRRADALARQQHRAADAHKKRIEALEARIADRERAIKELEASMAAPGFYDDRDAARPIIDRHQALMWEVGDLMHQWEELSTGRQS